MWIFTCNTVCNLKKEKKKMNGVNMMRYLCVCVCVVVVVVAAAAC